mmetsp:Transcript_23861/g.53848  ORF Transcript_23861/g.53848 Transcript_23861/m.53848 type:complete len:394 (-) Transcript_23861:461-1642(-)
MGLLGRPAPPSLVASLAAPRRGERGRPQIELRRGPGGLLDLEAPPVRGVHHPAGRAHEVEEVEPRIGHARLLEEFVAARRRPIIVGFGDSLAEVLHLPLLQPIGQHVEHRDPFGPGLVGRRPPRAGHTQEVPRRPPAAGLVLELALASKEAAGRVCGSLGEHEVGGVSEEPVGELHFPGLVPVQRDARRGRVPSRADATRRPGLLRKERGRRRRRRLGDACLLGMGGGDGRGGIPKGLVDHFHLPLLLTARHQLPHRQVAHAPPAPPDAGAARPTAPAAAHAQAAAARADARHAVALGPRGTDLGPPSLRALGALGARRGRGGGLHALEVSEDGGDAPPAVFAVGHTLELLVRELELPILPPVVHELQTRHAHETLGQSGGGRRLGLQELRLE